MDYTLEKFDFNPELLAKIIKSNVLLYCVVLLLVLKIATVLVSINFPQNIFFADITKFALENFANQTRQSQGLPVLVENQKLNQAAQMKAENMVRNQYFSHTSPQGLTPWHWFLQAGYNYKYAGENLAIGFFESEEVYNAWINSASHKANILNPNYKEVGTAVLKGFGQNNAIVVVQEFGSVANNSAKINTQKTTIEKPVVKTQPAQPKVLSQATESQNNYDYNYNKLFDNIIYEFSAIIMAILLGLIFFDLGKNFNKELVFRSVLIVILLSLAITLNKDFIILFIPHKIII
jgi:hypothetical protein